MEKIVTLENGSRQRVLPNGKRIFISGPTKGKIGVSDTKKLGSGIISTILGLAGLGLKKRKPAKGGLIHTKVGGKIRKIPAPPRKTTIGKTRRLPVAPIKSRGGLIYTRVPF